MPIYEFYCRKCNTVYNFFARKADTEKIPFCPRCGTVKLKRQMSVFSKISGNREEPAEEGLPPIDESRMERAMEMLAGEADRVDENDPRGAARLMRKITEAAGMSLSSSMEEALARMERGEDPEKIEEEMGDLLEGEEPFLLESRGKRGKRKERPKVDETLYDL